MGKVDCMGCIAVHLEGCPHRDKPSTRDGVAHWTLPIKDVVALCELRWNEGVGGWWCGWAWIKPDGTWVYLGG